MSIYGTPSQCQIETGCSEGTILFLLSDWMLLLFFAAIDRELPPLIHLSCVKFGQSDDGFACLCHVEQIQGNPWCPPVCMYPGKDCGPRYRWHC